MNYQDALNVIKNKQSLGIVPGLERIWVLLDRIGNPQNSLKIIHVAGTNGKGTVCNIIAKSLEKSGYKTGLFTSPWVTDYREQIQINGEFIPEDIFADYIEKYSQYDATEFELITAIAYKYFFDSNVDYAVIECGMGGAEDSTNAIPTPEIAVITSVSMDHTNFLGDTIEKIAQEKAGIIKNGSKVVLYPNGNINGIFKERCISQNAELFEVQDKGNFHLNDIETAKTALNLLGVDKIADISLPARQEYIGDSVMLDGAHNLSGAQALEKALPKDRKITAVIGMMKDKDVVGYLKIIAPYCTRIITTTVSNQRAMNCDDLKHLAEKYCSDVTAVEKPFEAVKINNYDFLLVCGSFYLAREVRKELL